MSELQSLGRRINTLIARRDNGETVQTEIDALMIQVEAHPEAIAAARNAANETGAAYASAGL